jgi:hypothetical protein
VFFLPDTAIQIVIGIFISLFYIKAYSYLEPFIDDSNDLVWAAPHPRPTHNCSPCRGHHYLL